jgi:hypothetical protein
LRPLACSIFTAIAAAWRRRTRAGQHLALEHQRHQPLAVDDLEQRAMRRLARQHPAGRAGLGGAAIDEGGLLQFGLDLRRRGRPVRRQPVDPQVLEQSGSLLRQECAIVHARAAPAGTGPQTFGMPRQACSTRRIWSP